MKPVFSRLALLPIFSLVGGVGQSHGAPLITRVVSSSDFPEFDSIGGLALNTATINAVGDVLVPFVHTNARVHPYRWSRGIFSPFIPAGVELPGRPTETINAFVPGHLSNSGVVSIVAVTPDGERILRGGTGTSAVPSLVAGSRIDPYRTVQRPFVSDTGAATFLASVPVPGSSSGLRSVVVTSSPTGSSATVLAAGDPVPVAVDLDDPNKTISSVEAIALSRAGGVSCILSRNAFGNFGMVLTGVGGSWTEAARLFEPATGTGHEFRSFHEITAATGWTAFSATTTLGANGQTGVWLAGPGGGLQLVGIGAEPFGDTPGTTVVGGNLSTVHLPLVADTGDCYLRASLAHGPGVDASNDELILHFRGAALQVVVREGDLAPGLPPAEGWRLLQLPGRFAINPRGRLAMIAEATSTAGLTHRWLWVGSGDGSGVVEPVLKVGDSIGGKAIADLQLFTGFDTDNGNPTGRSNADGKPGPFNAFGQLVVGVTHPDERAIYILDFSRVRAPATPIQLGTPAASPDFVAIPFFGKMGERYQLNRSSDLTNWLPAGDPFDGADLGVFLTDSPPAESPGYHYRLERLTP